jgi:hypothetical protein
VFSKTKKFYVCLSPRRLGWLGKKKHWRSICPFKEKRIHISAHFLFSLLTKQPLQLAHEQFEIKTAIVLSKVCVALCGLTNIFFRRVEIFESKYIMQILDNFDILRFFS